MLGSGEAEVDALSALENLHRVARFMMVQHPLDAEEMALVIPEVVDVLTSGDGAVKLIDKYGRAEFIVVRQGQRRTLKELPPDFEGGVTEARVEVREPRLRPALNALAERLRKLSLDVYEQAKIPALLGALATYDEEEDRNTADLVSLTNAFTLKLSAEQWSSSEDIRQAYGDGIKIIGDAFLRMMLPGDVAAEASAAAWLFANSPDPGLVIDVAIPGARAMLGPPPDKPSMPVLSARMIIEALNAIGGVGCDISWRISRGLQRSADEVLRAADEADDFLHFHRHLHRAFLSYRTAQFLLTATMESLDGDRCAVDVADVRKRRDISEEKRVIIVNSLLTSALDRPFSPNLTWLQRWEEWLASLRVLPLSAATDSIDDYYLRLMFPERIRKIAESCTNLDHGRSDRRVLDREMRTARAISIGPSDVGSFPVQAASLRARIARELRRAGSADAALEWSRSAGPYMDTIDALLAALEAEASPGDPD